MSADYAKGYTTGRVATLRGIHDRLKEDPELRTVVAVAELINVQLEDALKERESIYSHSKDKSESEDK